jgi:hypothetical protein
LDSKQICVKFHGNSKKNLKNPNGILSNTWNPRETQKLNGNLIGILQQKKKSSTLPSADKVATPAGKVK